MEDTTEVQRGIKAQEIEDGKKRYGRARKAFREALRYAAGGAVFAAIVAPSTIWAVRTLGLGRQDLAAHVNMEPTPIVERIDKSTPAYPFCTYIVQRGDTLSHIAAEELGDMSLYPAIAERNELADPSQIEVGQVLDICINGVPIGSSTGQEADVMRKLEQYQNESPTETPTETPAEVVKQKESVPKPQGEISEEVRKQLNDATTRVLIKGIDPGTGQEVRSSCTGVNVDSAGKITFSTHCVKKFMDENGVVHAEIKVGHPDWRWYDVENYRYTVENDVLVASLAGFEGDMGFVESGDHRNLRQGDTVFSFNYQTGRDTILIRRLVYVGEIQKTTQNGTLVSRLVFADNEPGIGEEDRMQGGSSGSLIFGADGRYLASHRGTYTKGVHDEAIALELERLGYSVDDSIVKLCYAVSEDVINGLK